MNSCGCQLRALDHLLDDVVGDQLSHTLWHLLFKAYGWTDDLVRREEHFIDRRDGRGKRVDYAFSCAAATVG